MKHKEKIKRNIRDLSYLPREDGKKLEEGMFFRSGSLYKASPRFVSYIKDKGIKTIIDLRTPGEIAKKPDVKIEGIRYIEIPILKAETIGITHERGLKGYKAPPHMPTLYEGLVTNEESIEGIKKALGVIFDEDRQGAILWHCTAGKDRVGIISALFLLILGYEEETVMGDYLLSNAPSEKRGRKYRRLIKYLLFKKELSEAVFQAMLAKREYLRSSFAAMERKDGSIKEYITKTLGYSEQEIGDIRKRLLG